VELLGRGAKVSAKAKNNLGATPLHLAAKLGALRIARELLAVGARPDAKDQVHDHKT
jgi:ankyrin repeat protein